MKKSAIFVGQAFVLWAVYWAGNQLALGLRLPIPGNVVGMILLFGLLNCGIVKPLYIQGATDFFLKHMAFFFIPIAVGLMNWGPFFLKNGIVLALAISISVAATLLAAGFLAQLLHRGQK